MVLTPPEEDEPVEPLVPELLLVPAVPPDEVDGMVDVELPEAPMPDVVPEVDEPPMPVEPVIGEAPPMCGPPMVGALVDDSAARALLAGEVTPLAEPPAAPMPEAEPVAEPDIEGPELQAARAADAASANKILCMDVSPEKVADEAPKCAWVSMRLAAAGSRSHLTRPPVGRTAPRP